VTWYEQGAERLHLVDLDGAVGGKPVNRDAIRDILKSVPIPAELGGGIRNLATVEAYFELGVRWVILGTAAIKDPVFVEKACTAFSDRILLAIDAKNNFVAVEGWTESTAMNAQDLARKFEGMGISAIIYTDVERDGMSAGPNIKATEEFAKQVHVPVIASGGISGIEDVQRIKALAGFGVIGLITGRALYEGKLSLRDAIKMAGD
jgi:phosphoribosylformimino-5-aminoimidazole carboxamide ribotide isomerase